MARYHFPGFPAFLEIAAAEIGHPELSVTARRDSTLAAVATLCAQAADADPRHVAGILAEAESLSLRLLAAFRASEMMLADVRDGRAPSPPTESPRRPRTTAKPVETRGGRHG